MSESPKTVMQVEIAASRERAWRALTGEVEAWWPDSFSVSGEGRLRLEAVPGGRLWEDWGERGGMVWQTVVNVQAPERLDLCGDIFPEWGGPDRVYTTFLLTEAGETTLLKFREAHLAKPSAGTLKSLEDGWRFLLHDCLKAHLEGRPIPEWTG